MIQKIVSGGQAGVDRAALDVALEMGIVCSGWCPKGRKAEDGVIDVRYPLTETPSSEYSERTEWNARDSDGTLIINLGDLTGGAALTLEMAVRYQKPHLIVQLEADPDVRSVSEWISVHEIKTLNVAGPRESQRPGIYREASTFVRKIILH